MARKTANRSSTPKQTNTPAAEKGGQDAEQSPEVREAAEAVCRARAELDNAEQLYQQVRQEAAEQLQRVKETTVGDLIDATLDAVKKYPAAGLLAAGAVGYLLGRLLGKLLGKWKRFAPMATQIVDPEQERVKRDIRLRIGRLRRRIDRRLGAGRRCVRTAFSWWRYLGRLPRFAGLFWFVKELRRIWANREPPPVAAQDKETDGV